jgi:hypothetical protein
MTHRARLARSDRSRVIQGKIEITISTACFLVCFPRACARAMGRRLQSALHIHATHPSSRSTRCALRPRCAMQRRHGRIRSSTCNNAIVRTAGNNWAIYESGGLALRMYDYCGKRCVARTPWTVRDAPRGPVVPPHTPIARNYSRSHCISISRLDRENHSGNPPRGHRIRRIAEAPWRWCPRLSLSLSLKSIGSKSIGDIRVAEKKENWSVNFISFYDCNIFSARIRAIAEFVNAAMSLARLSYAWFLSLKMINQAINQWIGQAPTVS